jgi:hypothetical protein
MGRRRRRNALKNSDSRGERNLNGNDNVTCQSQGSLKWYFNPSPL